MKILIIRNYPSYMDIQYNTYNIQEVGLAKALVRSGHKCDIVFWTDNEQKDTELHFDDNKKITVYYRNGKNLLKNAIYTDIDSLIAEYDIIQPCEYNQLQAFLLAKKYRKKTVIYHGPYFSPFNKRYNAMCRLTDLFVLNTYKKYNTPFIVKSRLAERFLLEKGIKKENITVAGVGIDKDTFAPKAAGEIPQNVLRVNDFKDKLRLLYIGRLEPRRNIPFLFDVLSELRSRGADAELIMVGSGSSDYVDRAFEHAKTLGVDSFIYRIEKAEQRHLSYIYENSDVFLLPTHYEIFGMVLLEAMHFSKPVITTENGGADMLIENGKNGIVINSFSKEAWADAVLSVKDNEKIGTLARGKIENEFTWQAIAPKFIDVYSRLNSKESKK